MKKLAVLTVVFFCVHLASAQDPKARVEKMFASFTPGNIEQPMNEFAKDSLISSELLDRIRSQAQNVFSPEKKILGVEFLREENVGSSIKRFTYLLKTVDEPFVWTFTFYKPQDTWLPLRVYFADDF